MALLTLFLSAFTSATLLPGSSEAVFLLMLSQETWNTGLLILSAGAGNALGGMSNWVLGLLIRNGLLKEKQNTSENKQRLKTAPLLQKYGSPLLFFSFLPVIGDPLCLVAGLLKIHWLKAIIFITLGKFFRYFALALVF